MNSPSIILRRLSLAALFVTIALTCGIGGTITSAEVGMAYPTWPNINSGSLFNFFYDELAASFGVGSVIEHTHRQAASLTGLIILLLAGYTWVKRKLVSKDIRNLATASLIVVIGQGLLGASRVLENDYLIAILHALGAQLVVAMLVVLCLKTSPKWSETFAPVAAKKVAQLQRWTSLAMLLLFANLFSAASLRHKQGAFDGHLILAVTVSVVVLFIIYLVNTGIKQHPPLRKHARGLAHLLGTQLALGTAAWAFLLGPLMVYVTDEDTRFMVQSLIATGHLLCGVLVLAKMTAVWYEVKTRLEVKQDA
ncbi:MAG: cytochrome c oxidase assembly protein subunit 15 [Myxococcota bacterium]|jgi:cytochrome c oxidase assembly protein subunit 15